MNEIILIHLISTLLVLRLAVRSSATARWRKMCFDVVLPGALPGPPEALRWLTNNDAVLDCSDWAFLIAV